MNERIKELVRQAVIAVDDPFPGNPLNDELEKMYIPDCFSEKFAQLIVQSIIDLLESDRKDYDNPGKYQPIEYYDRMEAKETAISDAIDSIKYTYLREE